MECGTPVACNAASSSALPRKYSYGLSSDGLVMLTCTTRPTPARAAASKSTRVLRTATACEKPAWANRTQYVFTSTSARWQAASSATGSSKLSGKTATASPNGCARSGEPVSVRTVCSAASRRPVMYRPEYPNAPVTT